MPGRHNTERHGTGPMVLFRASGGRPPPRSRGGNRRCVRNIADGYERIVQVGHLDISPDPCIL